MKSATRRVSILKVYAILFLVSCIGFTIYNYRQLSAGEGSGVVSMIGLIGFGAILFFIDIALHNILKNKLVANVIGLVITICFSIWVYKGMFSQ
jgi:hypothetical protein